MTPEQKIDEATRALLEAGNLQQFASQHTVELMRDAMRKIIAESYVAGADDNYKVMVKEWR